MNNNLQIDTVVVREAQLELLRLTRNHSPQHIKWEHIDEFREMLTMACSGSQNKEIQEFLDRVMDEFHRKYPCQRMNDTTLKGVVNELESLIRDKSSGITHRAKRLHNFCCVFSFHINGGNEGVHLGGAVRLSESEITI